MRGIDQKERDHNRKTYRLTFPSDMDGESIVTWIRAISGTLRASKHRLVGTPTVAFELMATSAGITHRLKVQWQYADYIISQLRSLVPGIRVDPEETFEGRAWTSAVEVGLTHSSRQLRIYNQASTAASLLASVQALEDKEAIIMQWVVTPAVPTSPPVQHHARTHRSGYKAALYGLEATADEVSDRRQKLEEPNMLAVLRVAAHASTSIRAEHLIHRVRASLASTRSATVRFKKRMASKGQLQKRIDQASAPQMFPMQLSASELAALIAWPIGNPFVTGLPHPLGRQFPPDQNILKDGIVLGTSLHPGSERPIALGFDEALMHAWIGGSTGTGKSVVLANMARQIMDAGLGLIVMETEGNLHQSVLDYVPEERIEDVVVLDVGDGDHPVGFNVLDQGSPMAVIDQIINLFNHKYNTSLWAEEYLYHGLRTIVASENLGFTDLVPLLVPRGDETQWVDAVVRNLKDPELLRWWQRQDNRDRRQQQQRSDPVLSRIWQLASRPELRFIFGQRHSTFTISEVMKGNKILLINLKGVSKESASLAGTLIMNAIWQATKSVSKDKSTFVMLDEFADYMDLPIDTESMLAQARKHKVGLILANQHLSQLTQNVRDAVMANARSKLVLQTHVDDGRVLARQMGTDLQPDDFSRLPLYEGIVQLLTPSGRSHPVSIKTVPPQASRGQGGKVEAASRRKYSRSVAEVEAELEQRRTAKMTPRGKRPMIGSINGSWGLDSGTTLINNDTNEDNQL